MNSLYFLLVLYLNDSLVSDTIIVDDPVGSVFEIIPIFLCTYQ